MESKEKINKIELHIHNKAEWEKFKEITKSYNLNSINEFLKIQDKMIKEGIMTKEEKGHFGPKTIRYLKENYYQKLETQELIEYTKTSEKGKEIKNEHQGYLNFLNKETHKITKNTIKNTREGFKNIHGNINIYLSSGKRKKTIGKINENSIYNSYYNEVNNNYTLQLKQQLDKYNGTGKTPVEALSEIFKKAPEKEKIQMAQILGAYMGDHYDNEMNESGDLRDISSEKMWEIYAKGGVAGVCRHMHSEVAKFLEKSGITAGVITTNSGLRHAITIGKLKNGKYFFIDYGTYYEGSNLMDLTNNYLAKHGAIDFKEYIGKADGKIIKIIQTELEKKFEETTSSSGVGDIMILSRNIANGGWKIQKGWNASIKASNQDKKLNISYGNGKNGLEVFYNKTLLGFSNYTSYGLGGQASWGDKYGKYGKTGLSFKYSKNHFSWEDYGTEKNFNVFSANINYAKNLYNTKENQVNFGTGIEGSLMWKNNIDKPIDGYGKGAMTIDWKHKINNNLSTELYGTLGADFGFKNIRDNRPSELTLYSKYGFGGAITYNNKDLLTRLEAGYEEGMGYKKYKIGAKLNKGKITLEGKHSKEKDTSHLKLGNNTITDIGIEYDVNSALKTYLSYRHTKKDGREKNGVSAGLKYKF